MVGGREQYSRSGIEYSATPADKSFFQARYAIRHWWTGPLKCTHPTRGVWGGPPDGGDTAVIAANKVAFAPRGRLALGQVIGRDLWEIGFKKEAAPAKKPVPGAPSPAKVKAMGFGGGMNRCKTCGIAVFGARRGFLEETGAIWR